MKLREQLLAEHSKANCDLIVKWIGKDQQRFDELFSLFVGDEYRVVQHAAWPLSYAVIANPSLIKKHFPQLIANLKKEGVHAAVRRNTMRLLQEISLPRGAHGEIMDACFRFITSPDEPTAVKAFSLTVLERLAADYPEIIHEVELIIEDEYPRQTAGFRKRADRFLKKHVRRKQP